MRWTAVSSLAFVPAAVFSWCRESRLLAALTASLAATSSVHHWNLLRPDLYRYGRLVGALDAVLANLLGAWAASVVPSLPAREGTCCSLALVYVVAVFYGVLSKMPKSCYCPSAPSYSRRVVALHASVHVVSAALIAIMAPFL